MDSNFSAINVWGYILLNLAVENPDFLTTFTVHMKDSSRNGAITEGYKPAHSDIKLKMTAKAFGFEWKKFSDYSLDNLDKLLFVR